MYQNRQVYPNTHKNTQRRNEFFFNFALIFTASNYWAVCNPTLTLIANVNPSLPKVFFTLVWFIRYLFSKFHETSVTHNCLPTASAHHKRRYLSDVNSATSVSPRHWYTGGDMGGGDTDPRTERFTEFSNKPR